MKTLSIISLTTFCVLLTIENGSCQGLPKDAASFFKSHCVRCHDSERKKGGLDLSSLSGKLSDRKRMAQWVRIHDRIAKGEMPPTRKPSEKETSNFLKMLAKHLTRADLQRRATVMRRLNRQEYQHTLHDLLGIHVELKNMLPEDGKAFGFDNVGEGLDLSSVHLQRYLQAGAKALDAAVHKNLKPKKTVSRHSFGDGRNAAYVGKHWLKRPDDAIVFFNNGRYPAVVLHSFRVKTEGVYRIRIHGYAYQSKTPIVFAVYTGGPFNRDPDLTLRGYYSIPPGKTTPVELRLRLRPKATLRLMPYLNAPYRELKKAGVAGYKGRGLAVRTVEIEGPLIDDWPGGGHRLLFGDLAIRRTKPVRRFQKPTAEILSANPKVDAQRLLARFLPLAFRRPVEANRVAPYLRLFENERKAGSNFEEAMRTAYLAVLCSPDFLFRLESPGKLDGHALATRLSYFLWSSMPDDTLLSLAQKGELQKPDVLREQTERMLRDPKSKRFTKHFVGQWLNLRAINFTMPDRKLYPEFDNLLHDAMVRETEGFFDEVLHNKRSLTEFIDSDWTMLNERLARHYRIGGVKGLAFRKVVLPQYSHRGGVLTHASVLRVSANGTTTSPVLRGAWVLERILDEPPQPPPPGIAGVEPDIRGAKTIREQLAKHRNVASCAACHRHIDPPGFALENYDVMGGWRTYYRSLNKRAPRPPVEDTFGLRVQWRIGPKVDASGTTPNGKTFRNLEEYKKILLADKNRFARALTRKVATYATGRGMGFSDRPEIERIVRATERKNYVFRELVHEVVQSEIFRRK